MKHRDDQPLARDVKAPELTATPDGTIGMRVYLCRDCAAVLRAKQAENGGGRLERIEVRWLCPTCRGHVSSGS